MLTHPFEVDIAATGAAFDGGENVADAGIVCCHDEI
jgi:hypothetical protein